ncbi:MAG: DNA-processing protein DprA [Synergistaceae bacterium]|jgi:DNA processing protein|nr:DNA-processing protein DprA [Synergistaceae bacterium]
MPGDDPTRPVLLLNNCQYYDIRAWERFEETGLEAAAFIEGGPPLWEALGINERNRGQMSADLSSGWVDSEIDACAKLGVKLVTCRDPLYPPPLLEMKDAPLLLYVRGTRLSLPGNVVGVVGTRRCSAYGTKVAREMGRLAAGHGWSVVSGGAKGIDGAAHAGCLDGGGVTAAVLGTGVDVVYPQEHRKLFDAITEAGALYSEYRLGCGGNGWRFPRRNRIIAGLSSRTVVVEAPRRSGALITARHAAEAGRDVWAVPGRVDDDRCWGSNCLIFDGAMPLFDFEFFFGETDPQKACFPDIPEADAAGRAKNRLGDMSEGEKILVALLTNLGDRTIDNLAGEAKMSAAEVFKAISMLSLRGVIFSSGSGRYSLAD